MSYQCLGIAGDILFAAQGSNIDTFAISNGSKLSSFACSRNLAAHEAREVGIADSSKDIEAQTKSETSSVDIVLASVPPPAKRRKLSNDADEDHAANGKEEPKVRKDKKRNGTSANSGGLNVAVLTTTRDGTHVIAVTGEDKSLRVFKHDGKGRLEQLSERNMPKRPCALALTSDETTIISADKFGDVYGLPLIVPEGQEESGEANISSKTSTPTPQPVRLPAANSLTVHTKKNLRSLENQLRQPKPSQNKVERTFEHKLLLGHVSLLTDVKSAKRDNRNYILTADRDEHIRISRGIPQTHVIEGFCLGHVEFVSRLCLVDTHPSILISGGGDDNLFVWDWLEGRVKQKVNLRPLVSKGLEKLKASNSDKDVEESSEPVKIAVSAIKHLQSGPGVHKNTIVVTCESVPSVFLLSLSDDGTLALYETIDLDGNPLDIVADDLTGRLIVSIDLIHKPGSTHEIRENIDDGAQPIRMFVVDGQGWAETHIRFAVDRDVVLPLEGLSEVLYNIENLRKRVGED